MSIGSVKKKREKTHNVGTTACTCIPEGLAVPCGDGDDTRKDSEGGREQLHTG